ncbi:MAG TPA: protein kinase [Gemmatimonadales bacterium]|nr:protein kinase [Gemmatimonadales bacterium]
MTELRDRLQAALGSAYRIEQELGGGGMSRVFLAEETALGRRVVVKVLPPEMAAGVNIERFRREIQLAASLQHPHIVPLHAAGQAGDLFYYTMPLVEGESLRAKLAREGELPVAETVRILRDVADALAYAHAHGVVHRDIKPDNVLISGQHAVVTDFGVAKAVSAATGATTLTSLGVALGTPAYMAPEQAAADPHVDHRADLYAVGAMAYEMLCGHPPFTGMTPQAMLAAHVTQAPQALTAHRPAVPQALNAIVMRCLEKKPADRVQRADELLGQLQAMSTPTGGMAPTGTTPVISSGTEAAIRRGHPARVAALFAVAAAALLAVIDLLMVKIGLPGWVFAAAVVLLALGLPIMLITGVLERRRALARTSGSTPLAATNGVRGLFTWRKAILGGATTFGALAIGTAVYMAMRALGIGPVGTLVASGALRDRQKVILAEFANRAADTTLGPTLTEAFRVDLAQSPTVKLMDGRMVAAALARMQRDPASRLTSDLAREVAEREGVTALVTGEINPVDKGYVLSASVVSASDGQVLTAVRTTAADGAHLIGALDQLSKDLRERIGDSFKSLRATAPLAQVTTGSLDALRRYSQAVRLFNQGDQEAAIPLLQEATTLDTSFAMAYRKLSAILNNTGGSYEQLVSAATRAFRHSDRLSDLERDLTAAWYYEKVNWNPPQIVAAYRAALDVDPNSDVALNNLSNELTREGRWTAAESLLERGIALGYGGVFYQNAYQAQVLQGHLDAARATTEHYAQAWPNDPGVPNQRAFLAAVQHDYATAERTLTALRAGTQAGTGMHEGTAWALSFVAEVQGELGRSASFLHDVQSDAKLRGLPSDQLTAAISLGWQELRYRDHAPRALALVAAALANVPLASLPPESRPYAELARFYAAAGKIVEAQALMADYERLVPEGLRRGDVGRLWTAAQIADAQGHYSDAVDQYTHGRQESGCQVCALFEMARAYEKLGQTDSALATYERFVDQPGPYRLVTDAYALAPTYKRLAELYEARGDRAKARDFYGRFLDLWKNADAELQPLVTDVKQRLARLAGEH